MRCGSFIIQRIPLKRRTKCLTMGRRLNSLSAKIRPSSGISGQPGMRGARWRPFCPQPSRGPFYSRPVADRQHIGGIDWPAHREPRLPRGRRRRSPGMHEAAATTFPAPVSPSPRGSAPRQGSPTPGSGFGGGNYLDHGRRRGPTQACNGPRPWPATDRPRG